jgi:hypothetical protein
MLNVLKSERKQGVAGEELVTVVVETGTYPITPHYIFTFKVLGTDMPGEAIALRMLSVVNETTLEAIEPPEEIMDEAARAAANLACEDSIQAW